MATYLAINLLFISAVILLFKVKITKPFKMLFITLIILLILTAIFDSIIVGLDIVGYDKSKILGVYIIKAPVEDFFYSLLAVILVPSLWSLYERKD